MRHCRSEGAKRPASMSCVAAICMQDLDQVTPIKRRKLSIFKSRSGPLPRWLHTFQGYVEFMKVAEVPMNHVIGQKASYP